MVGPSQGGLAGSLAACSACPHACGQQRGGTRTLGVCTVLSWSRLHVAASVAACQRQESACNTSTAGSCAMRCMTLFSYTSRCDSHVVVSLPGASAARLSFVTATSWRGWLLLAAKAAVCCASVKCSVMEEPV